mgnify:CR=1 FL=1
MIRISRISAFFSFFFKKKKEWQIKIQKPFMNSRWIVHSSHFSLFFWFCDWESAFLNRKKKGEVIIRLRIAQILIISDYIKLSAVCLFWKAIQSRDPLDLKQKDFVLFEKDKETVRSNSNQREKEGFNKSSKRRFPSISILFVSFWRHGRVVRRGTANPFFPSSNPGVAWSTKDIKSLTAKIEVKKILPGPGESVVICIYRYKGCSY